MTVIVMLAVASTSFAAGRADAAGSPIKASPGLSSSIDSSGSGAAVTAVRTRSLRTAAAGSETGPRVLVIGTGIERGLFPENLRPAITGAPSALDDTHGYGTIAASTIFQLLPEARITSVKARAYDASWTMLDLHHLARALEDAAASHANHDLVLLAFPPQAALDPISELIGHVGYGTFGRGMALVNEALLATPAATEGPAVGIPTDRALRDRMFARANLKQRDAVEKYVAAVQGWKRVTAAVEGLSRRGVSIVAPSGDFTRKAGSTIVPLVTQTIYGLSALPQVITVGAAYSADKAWRLSPTSGRGPTLTLGAKPDVLAPADVMAMLPADAYLQWADDSARAPLEMLEWAAPNVAPTPCPSLTRTYRCILQGSSMVSAAVVAANVASMVAAGVPRAARDRQGGDDEILRGIVWSAGSRTRAASTDGDRAAHPWEQGAGVVTGLGSVDLASTPVLLERPDLGEVAWGKAASRTLSFWPGGALPAATTASVGSFIGPDANGAAVAHAYDAGNRVSTTRDGWVTTVTVSGARAQGGLYAGAINVAAANGSAVAVPLSFVQTVPLEFHMDYAYNEWQGANGEGERVEKQTVVLFAGLPTNVGLVGEAFKNFSTAAWSRYGGDPTFSMVIRYATTKDSFTGAPVADHGRARIDAMPPGFYRMHMLSDHSIDAVQARGRDEALGIKLASSGPESATIPGANLLVGSRPGCDEASAEGPMSPPCQERDPSKQEIDPATGLCVVRNSSTQVAFNLYCGEIGYAVPTAFVSRAVHQIDHDADATKSEWKTCNVDLALNGSPIDFEAIAAQASRCGGMTTPTAWTFSPGARNCLGPTERASDPKGVPTDVTASYKSAAISTVPGRNVPVGVLTYKFALPYLNTYTVAGLSFSYVADNAIVGVRFKTNSAGAGDASHGILVVDDPNVAVKPVLQGARAKGSVFNEWSVMSSNAATGELSLIVIPTAGTRTGLDPEKPIAQVELCDVAMRVMTYAKQAWGTANIEGGRPVQFFPSLDRGLVEQTAATKPRMRSTYDPSTGSFTDAGEEREDLVFAVQIPKNTTTNASAAHRVRSPKGGPAHLTSVRRWGTDAARHERVLDDGFRAYDPRMGVTPLACSEGAATTDPQRALAHETCKLWNAARAASETVGHLFGDLSVNGRFAGTLAIDRATIVRAAGNVAWEIADADDGGAFEPRWARSGGALVPRVPISDFYDDAPNQLSLSLLSGAISARKDTAGNPVLTIQAAGVSKTFTITTTLK